MGFVGGAFSACNQCWFSIFRETGPPYLATFIVVNVITGFAV